MSMVKIIRNLLNDYCKAFFLCFVKTMFPGLSFFFFKLQGGVSAGEATEGLGARAGVSGGHNSRRGQEAKTGGLCGVKQKLRRGHRSINYGWGVSSGGGVLS